MAAVVFKGPKLTQFCCCPIGGSAFPPLHCIYMIIWWDQGNHKKITHKDGLFMASQGRFLTSLNSVNNREKFPAPPTHFVRILSIRSSSPLPLSGWPIMKLFLNHSPSPITSHSLSLASSLPHLPVYLSLCLNFYKLNQSKSPTLTMPRKWVNSIFPGFLRPQKEICHTIPLSILLYRIWQALSVSVANTFRRKQP